VLISDQKADKSHEIPAAQQLIQELNLTGCLFTLDALHAQKNG
jgi:predicted transposase YbfD/YdcC